MNYRPLVNCCKEGSHGIAKIQAVLLEPRQALVQDREVELALLIQWPSLESIMAKSYRLDNITARLHVPDNFEIRSDSIAGPEVLSPGKSCIFSWKVHLGSQTGSFPVSAEAAGSLDLPAWPWEEHRKRQVFTITARSNLRLDVKGKAWFDLYGRF